MKWGRGIDYKLGEKFVKMYVSELTIDMGEAGKRALELLYQKAAVKGLIPRIPDVTLV
jgi:1,4-dihydroxy-6-naphthoate synthase